MLRRNCVLLCLGEIFCRFFKVHLIYDVIEFQNFSIYFLSGWSVYWRELGIEVTNHPLSLHDIQFMILAVVVFLLWTWMPLCLFYKCSELQYPLDGYFLWWVCCVLPLWITFSLRCFLHLLFPILLLKVMSILDVKMSFLDKIEKWILFSYPMLVYKCVLLENWDC